jgi:hypothetical protein
MESTSVHGKNLSLQYNLYMKVHLHISDLYLMCLDYLCIVQTTPFIFLRVLSGTVPASVELILSTIGTNSGQVRICYLI